MADNIKFSDLSIYTYADLLNKLNILGEKNVFKVSPEQNILDYYKTICRDNIEYICYLLYECNSSHYRDKDISVHNIFLEIKDKKIMSPSIHNLFALYLNTYLYNYIKIEFNKIKNTITDNLNISPEKIVEDYVCRLIFPSEAKSTTVLYTLPSNMPLKRQNQLNKRISKLSSFLTDNKDNYEVYLVIFDLMTSYCGSNYNFVHLAVLDFLNINIGDFFHIFMENLNHIFNHKGAVTWLGYV